MTTMAAIQPTSTDASEQEFWNSVSGGCLTGQLEKLKTIDKMIAFLVEGKAGCGPFNPVDPRPHEGLAAGEKDVAYVNNGWRTFRLSSYRSGKTIMLKSIVNHLNKLEEIKELFELKMQPLVKNCLLSKTSIWQAGEKPDPIALKINETTYDDRVDGVLDRVVIIVKKVLDKSQEDLLQLLNTFITDFLNKYAGLESLDKAKARDTVL